MEEIAATVVFVSKLSLGDMVHRSNDGKLVGPLGQAWKILTKANTRQSCLRCIVFATNRVRSFRFGIEGLVLGGASGLKDEDYRFGP
jgi:hypothetical protein